MTTKLQAPHHEKHVISDRLCYYKHKTGHMQKTFAHEISHSLQQDCKYISPKFFYNQRGSELFEQICNLPEYYLTRTEISILSSIKQELQSFLGGKFRLVELGSGASIKTRHLLDVLKRRQSFIEYVPIDVSEFLEESTSSLLEDYPNLSIVGIMDTYENGLEFIGNYDDFNNLIAFFGSSFGNFPLKEGKIFLKAIWNSMKGDDLFLIGLDLIKDKTILKKAYDDSQGITAQFNLNVLDRINDELGADFDLSCFSHHCTYNQKEQRVEMYLQSLKNQNISIPKANLLLSLKEDELVHTENSHKFSIPKIYSLMEGEGFNVLKVWQDSEKKFAVILLSKNHRF